MRIAFDTNILVYAETANLKAADRDKPAKIDAILDVLSPDDAVLPVQVLGELYRVLVGKAHVSRADARRIIIDWADLYPVIDTSFAALASAVDLCADHNFSIWDALILSAAAEAGCRYLLSEDMQHGFTWRGVTIVDPFSESGDQFLRASLIGGS